MVRLLLILLLAASAASARAPQVAGGERERVAAEFITCLIEGFDHATATDADRASVSNMVKEYFDLAGIAALKYGARRFNRASNKRQLMAHASRVMTEQFLKNRAFFRSGWRPVFNPRSLKEIRPKGRFQITGRMPGGQAFVLRVSRKGPNGCRIHGLFYGGISISSLLDGKLITF
ncbi:MAG: hypothetical protein ACE5FS_08460 [Paracoccaceae bacterium]